MAYKKGESGNPSGRPPKSRALSDLLISTLNKQVETPQGKIAGKRLLAVLVVEALTTGQVQFPKDEKPSTLSVKDWTEFVKWAYQYLEPPLTRHELSTPENQPFEIRGVDYRTVASALAPRPIQDSDAPGESENTFDGSEMG